MDTDRFHLCVPDGQMENCTDLTGMIWYQDSASSNGHQGGHVTIKMASCKYRDSHDKDFIFIMEILKPGWTVFILKWGPEGHLKNTYELLNLRALKFSPMNKINHFQCLGKIFCVEFQRYPLKFHTKYLTHTLKDMISMQHWKFKSS